MIAMAPTPGRAARQLSITARLTLWLLCGLPTLTAAAESAPATGRFSHGVVAADHPLASEAGAEMLRRGGNVVDAAVATSFALSVVRPESCGLGGGGFMVIWNAETQSATALDYRERAPQRANAKMFIPSEETSDPTPNSRTGGLAAAIPGNVAGLCFALEHYGSLDLATVLGPAIRLAESGLQVDATAVRNQHETLGELNQLGEQAARFEHLRTLYLNRGQLWETGDRFDSPLETVLRRIAAEGADGFYRGEVGTALLAEVERQGGLWTSADLHPSQLVVERTPLRMRSAESEILTMPPPSSGGVALIEMLQLLAAYDQRFPQQLLSSLEHNSVPYLHRLTEASKHAFADRAAWLGDADFVDVPLARLTSPGYAELLARRFNPVITLAPSDYGRIALEDDAGTSHLSVIDAAGNAVACTETINTTYGSFVVEPKFGIILNNEMDDFTARPGEPNAFGLIQSERNAVAPGKKPLSSMTPTIVIRDGRAELAVGASGGPKIISGTWQVLLNVTRFDMSPSAAVAAPRMHHQWQPDQLQLESRLVEATNVQLERMGHAVSSVGGVGVVQAVTRDQHGLRAASDPRKGGVPAGW